MADKAPNSYKDPYWAQLASNAEASSSLPNGLLVSIVKNGEKSNADQVSDAKARTPFQITESTRDLALKKYGIDAYLSDQNAADVAGKLLRDSIDRNKGSVTDAIGEYHGGIDREAWGPKTKAYIARVVNGPELKSPQGSQVSSTTGGSTFDRVKQQMTPAQTSMAQVYQAYKSGQMSTDEVQQFESDVGQGLVMLPKGASLNGKSPQTEVAAQTTAMELPQAVTDAYVNNKMSPQERSDLEADIKSGAVKLPPTAASQIPGNDGAPPPTQQGIITQPPEPGIGQKLVGAGEAALSTATGLTAGTASMVAGTVEGIAKSILDGTYGTQQGVQNTQQAASSAAGAATYEPRTATGQQYTQNVGEAMQAAIPAAPLTGEMGLVGQGVRDAAPAVRAGAGMAAQAVADTVKPPVVAAVNAVKNAPQAAMEMVGLRDPVATAAPTGPGSVGAAATPMDTQRAVKADSLPVPLDLTKGAETRDPAQLAFEKEQMKNPSLGQPLRDRANENNLQAMQNFDALIDMTDAQSPDLSTTGNVVTKALSEGYKAAKNKTRAAYKAAEDSPESTAQVDATPIIDHLNSIPSGLKTTALADHAKQYAIRLGIATTDSDGNLIPIKATAVDSGTFKYKPVDYPDPDLPEPVFYKKEPVLNIPIDEIIPTQDSVKQKGVDLYKEGKGQFQKEPVEVFAYNGKYILVDGHHRVTAAALSGKTSIEAKIAGRVVGDVPSDPVPQSTTGGPTVKNMEAWRKEISQATGFEPAEVRDSTILKKMIDTQTEPVAGPLYLKARQLRTEQARKFENRGVVARLVTDKRGTEDPKVAADQVFHKSIMGSSPEEITFLKRVLSTSGKDGQQAWKELQGALVRHMQDQSTTGMGLDAGDRPIVSPAKLNAVVNQLDKNGRLDIVLGKKNAEIVRDLNDVVKYVNTVPPGTLINNSGTVGTLLAAMAEAGTTGALTGLPVPVMSILRALSKQINNNKMKLKINDALNAKPGKGKF